MGFDLSIEQVYTSSYATAIYARQKGIKNVYCIGSEGLIEELKTVGICVTGDENQAQAVIVGLDTDFNYSKMAKALHIIRKEKCKLIACNQDKNYPVEDDKLMPGCGPIVAAIEESCDKKVDYVVGKPNTCMLELLAKDWNLTNNEILVVGDSYTSDIEMAKRYNCLSVLISKEERLNVNDTIVVHNIKDIKKLFE